MGSLVNTCYIISYYRDTICFPRGFCLTTFTEKLAYEIRWLAVYNEMT